MKLTPEQFDSWRVVPRILMGLYGWACVHVLLWILDIPDPTSQQVAIFSTVWGGAAVWFGFYVNSGKTKWDSSRPNYSVPSQPLPYYSPQPGQFTMQGTMQGQQSNWPNANNVSQR